MSKPIKTVLIIFQIPIVFLLTVKLTETILQKSRYNVKGLNITRLDRDSLIFPTDASDLRYFYEITPNFLYKWKPDFLPNKVVNTINADSLNERYEYSVIKPKDNYRIITLGDSNVFGLYVETRLNFPEKLEDMLNGKLQCNNNTHFDVINLGVSGYDIEYSAERFFRRGEKYNPDLVIWMINEWNFQNINEFTLPLQKKYKDEGIPEFDPQTKKYVRTELVLTKLNETFGEQELFTYQKKALERLSNNYDGKILFISYPSLPARYKKLIAETVVRDPYKYNYFHSLTDLPNDKDYRLADFHPNEKGYQKMSEEIFDHLFKNYFRSCSDKP